MAEVITCTIYKVVLNGVGPKKYLARFPAMRGTVKCHERLDDALLFTLECIKRVIVARKRVQKKFTQRFAVRHESLDEERPMELHGKTVTVTPTKISVE